MTATEFLASFRTWRAGIITTREWNDDIAQQRVMELRRSGSFTMREIFRLEIYRRAVAAGFYTDYPR